MGAPRATILVTGGAGYVGSHMVSLLLERGHAVTVFDNLSRGHRDAVPRAAAFAHGELLDPASIAAALASARFDAVMHFAALCYVGESVRMPREYYRNNVVGTLNLLDAVGAAGIGRVVFSSTCATYGDPVATPMAEEHPQRPINAYGASKLTAEMALRDHARAYGLTSVALRYFNAAGCDPGGRIGERHDPETHLIPLVLLEALRVRSGGDPARTGLVVHGTDYDTPDGTCVRDYVHVDDLAAAHLAALEGMGNGALGGATAYNLGSGRGFSVLEVIESGRRVTGVPIEWRPGPRRPGDPARLIADARAAARDLAWTPRYRDLDAIVETAWRWFSKE